MKHLDNKDNTPSKVFLITHLDDATLFQIHKSDAPLISNLVVNNDIIQFAIERKQSQHRMTIKDNEREIRPLQNQGTGKSERESHLEICQHHREELENLQMVRVWHDYS